MYMGIRRTSILAILASLAFVLVVYNVGYAQDSARVGGKPDKHKFVNPQPTSIVVKLNPFLILWGSIPYTAEYRLVMEFTTSAKQATQIGVSYIDKSPLLQILLDSGESKNYIMRGGRFELSHRFYINRKDRYAPKGFFVSPHISYASARLSDKYLNSIDYYLRITQFNISVLAGYQWLLSDKFAINIFSGWGYKNNYVEEHYAQQTVIIDSDEFWPNFNSPIKFTLGLYFGWAF